MKKKNNKNNLKLLGILAAGLTISSAGYINYQNNHIDTSFYRYKSKKLGDQFNGTKILHITDLHNKSFGKNSCHLIKKISDISPDIIVITGDIIDRRKYNLKTAANLVKEISKISEVYYVPGNHEAWSGKYPEVRNALINNGAVVLDNQVAMIEKNGEYLKIIGLMDPGFNSQGYGKDRSNEEVENEIKDLSSGDEFKILLAHRPEHIKLYSRYNVDICFCGHAHGGQWRIPKIGGLYAPHQGILAKYTSGKYKVGNTTMFLSRGLGNSIMPVRIENKPELVLVELIKE